MLTARVGLAGRSQKAFGWHWLGWPLLRSCFEHAVSLHAPCVRAKSGPRYFMAASGLSEVPRSPHEAHTTAAFCCQVGSVAHDGRRVRDPPHGQADGLQRLGIGGLRRCPGATFAAAAPAYASRLRTQSRLSHSVTRSLGADGLSSHRFLLGQGHGFRADDCWTDDE